jgi:hypothetical protein
MTKYRAILLLPLLILLAAPAARPATVTFTWDEACQTAWLNPNYPDYPSSASPMDIEGFTDNKFLVNWNLLSKIPANSTITNATLTITKVKTCDTAGWGTFAVWVMDTYWDNTASYDWAITDTTDPLSGTPWRDYPGAGNVTFNDPVDTSTSNCSTLGNITFNVKGGVQTILCDLTIKGPDSGYGFLIDGLPGSKYHFYIGETNSGSPPILTVTYITSVYGCPMCKPYRAKLTESLCGKIAAKKLKTIVGCATRTANPKNPQPIGNRIEAKSFGSQINFKLYSTLTNSQANPQLLIYSIKGNIINRLNPQGSRYVPSYTWNGTDAAGRPLANGVFIARCADKSVKAKSFVLMR